MRATNVLNRKDAKFRFVRRLKCLIAQHRLVFFCLCFVVGVIFGELILWGPVNIFFAFTVFVVVLSTMAPRIFLPAIIAGSLWTIVNLLSVYELGGDDVSSLGRKRTTLSTSEGGGPLSSNDDKRSSDYLKGRKNGVYSGLSSNRGKVESIPRYRKPGLVEIIVETENGQRLLCQGVDLPWRNASQIRVGDVIRFKGSTIRLDPGDNLTSYERGLIREGIAGRCKLRWVSIEERIGQGGNLGVAELGEKLREKIEMLILPQERSSEAAGLFLALTLGVRDRISQETETAFRTFGISHLLVLSGYQISMVFGITYWLISFLMLRFCPIVVCGPQLFASFLGFIAAAILTVVSGLEKPAVRALSAVLLAQVTRIRGASSNVADHISVTVLFMIVFCRIPIIDPSIDLTLAAIIGIAIGNKGSIVGRYLWSNWCATAATGLVAIFWFGEWSWPALVFNPLVAPILGILPILAFSILLLLALISPELLGPASAAVLDAVDLVRDEIVALSHQIPAPEGNNPILGALVCMSIFCVAIARRRTI